MSYERQRTVKDGEYIEQDGNVEGVDPTKGTLNHGVDPDSKARPIKQHRHQGQIVIDMDALEALQDIREELKKLNKYMEIIVEARLD